MDSLQEHLVIFGRSIAAFLLLLIITKFLGKQTLSSMTFHDFATAIVIGAIAANMAFNNDVKHIHTFIAITVFSGTAFVLSTVALKNRRLRKWISGTPTVLIENGRILEDNMRHIRYTLDSLNQLLRQKGIFDIGEVEYAVLESNGEMSVLKKREYRNVTMKDLTEANERNVSAPASFPLELIMDGTILENNVRRAGLSPAWLTDRLTAQGKRTSDVFYAVRGTDGRLYFDFYDDDLRLPIDNEGSPGHSWM